MFLNPSALLDANLGKLATALPAVRMADVDAVHDARILTRRLRELLPLAGQIHSDAGEAIEQITAAGRVLGQVRELDVLDEMLRSLETRARFAAVTISDLRRHVREKQDQARRQLVKALEHSDLDALVRQWRLRRPQKSGAWARALRQRIGRRAEQAREAGARAVGVYMPNRSHRARIRIKKLRYAVEIAADTQIWLPPRVLKELRRAQSTLGNLHDLQVLVERLERLPTADAARVREVEWLVDLLRADVETGHRAFVQRAPKLQAAVAECEHWSGVRGSAAWPQRMSRVLRVMVGSAMLVPTVLNVIDRARTRTPGGGPTARVRGAADSPSPIRAV